MVTYFLELQRTAASVLASKGQEEVEALLYQHVMVHGELAVMGARSDKSRPGGGQHMWRNRLVALHQERFTWLENSCMLLLC